MHLPPATLMPPGFSPQGKGLWDADPPPALRSSPLLPFYITLMSLLLRGLVVSMNGLLTHGDLSPGPQVPP